MVPGRKARWPSPNSSGNYEAGRRHRALRAGLAVRAFLLGADRLRPPSPAGDAGRLCAGPRGGRRRPVGAACCLAPRGRGRNHADRRRGRAFARGARQARFIANRPRAKNDGPVLGRGAGLPPGEAARDDRAFALGFAEQEGHRRRRRSRRGLFAKARWRRRREIIRRAVAAGRRAFKAPRQKRAFHDRDVRLRRLLAIRSARARAARRRAKQSARVFSGGRRGARRIGDQLRGADQRPLRRTGAARAPRRARRFSTARPAAASLAPRRSHAGRITGLAQNPRPPRAAARRASRSKDRRGRQ